MTKGILIIATGHHIYGRMAYNLAVSIKAKDSALQIALIHNEKTLAHLNDVQKEIFDHRIKTERQWAELKLRAVEFSPFDQTLLMDADMLWIQDNPAKVFEVLKTTDFTSVNEGYFDMKTGEDKTNPKYTLDIYRKLYDHYKCKSDKFWVIRSEFMLFNKTKLTKKIFKDAWRVYNDKKLKSILEGVQFAGVLPDEFAFDTAIAINNIDCHEFKWQASYWPLIHGNYIPEVRNLKSYYTISFGGNAYIQRTKDTYDTIMSAAAFKIGVKHVFKLQSKKEHLTERKLF